MAIAVVAGPLVAVVENFERLGGFLEADDRLLVARILVRMDT